MSFAKPKVKVIMRRKGWRIKIRERYDKHRENEDGGDIRSERNG